MEHDKYVDGEKGKRFGVDKGRFERMDWSTCGLGRENGGVQKELET